MTDGPDPPEDADLALLLEQAAKSVRRAMRAVDEMILDVETTPTTDPAEAKRLLEKVGELNKSHSKLVEALGRVKDEHKRMGFGTAGGIALDLDAARAEVGRRLAKLRSSGGADRVSGQSGAGVDRSPAVGV